MLTIEQNKNIVTSDIWKTCFAILKGHIPGRWYPVFDSNYPVIHWEWPFEQTTEIKEIFEQYDNGSEVNLLEFQKIYKDLNSFVLSTRQELKKQLQKGTEYAKNRN